MNEHKLRIICISIRISKEKKTQRIWQRALILDNGGKCTKKCSGEFCYIKTKEKRTV